MQATDVSMDLIWDRSDTDSRIKLQDALAFWKLLPYSTLTDNLDKIVNNYIGTIPNSAHFKYSSSPLWIAGVKKLTWDSDFFGFGIGRLEPLVSDSSKALSADAITYGDNIILQSIELAKQLGLNQLSAPVHCSDTLAHLCLQRAGFLLMDTIVTYHLKDFHYSKIDLDPCIRKAEKKDLVALAQISGECFSNRRHNVNRFNSDTQFSLVKVREMYSLWLENSIEKGFADAVFAYFDNGIPVGFITATIPTAEDLGVGLKIGRIPLNAVHPEYQGRGIYTRLAKAAIGWLGSCDAEVIEIKTQLPNAGVHRTWSKFGAQNTCSFHTFHLNINEWQKQVEC